MLQRLKAASQRLQEIEAPSTAGIILGLPVGAVPILARLRAGQTWLTEQHRLHVVDDPQAASDERFSAALAAWDSLERVFRCSGYSDCIWGPGGSCPEDSPVLCDGCVSQVQTVP